MSARSEKPNPAPGQVWKVGPGEYLFLYGGKTTGLKNIIISQHGVYLGGADGKVLENWLYEDKTFVFDLQNLLKKLPL